MLDRSYWKGRRVLVTGHTGLKGSWLSLWLEALGAHVTGFALEPPANPSLFEQARVEQSLRSIRGDLRDYAALSDAVQQCRPEVVLHMGAQSVVRRGYDD